MWFSGDMYHQGYDSAKKRGYRFYAADIWCRGMFGHRQKTMALVFGTHMRIYTKDADNTEDAGSILHSEVVWYQEEDTIKYLCMVLLVMETLQVWRLIWLSLIAVLISITYSREWVTARNGESLMVMIDRQFILQTSVVGMS